MAKVVEQIRIQVVDKVGKLAEGAEALEEAGVNVVAVCAWVEGDKGHMLLLTDDNQKACSVLSDHVESCRMTTAVALILPHEVGAFSGAARKLADAGIQIDKCFATATGGEALIMLVTSDNQKAASLL